MRLALLLFATLLLFRCRANEDLRGDSFEDESVPALIQRVQRGEAFKVVQILRRRCDQKDSEACFGLGQVMDAWKRGGTERSTAGKYYGRACDLGHSEGCHRAAQFATLGKWGAEVDLQRAVKLFASACKASHQESCAWGAFLGGAQENAGSQNRATHLQTLHSLCQKKIPLACTFWARLSMLGTPSPATLQQAREHLVTGCNAKSPRACAYLGELYRLHKNLNKSLSPPDLYLERGCKAGVDVGCAGMAQIFMAKAGGRQYSPRVLKYLSDACMYGGLASCALLGQLYYEGKQIPISYGHALLFSTRGCGGGNAGSCLRAAKIYRYGQGVSASLDRYRHYLQLACRFGSREGCLQAGKLFIQAPKEKRDTARGLSLFAQGCKNGHLDSCTEEALFYESKDMGRAKQLHEKVCDKGGVRSCDRLGELLLKDKSMLKKSGRLALKIFSRSCNRKSAKGCFLLGRLHHEGIGVPKSRSRATTLFKRACALKSVAACSELAYQRYRSRSQTIVKRMKERKKISVACDGGDDWSCYLLGLTYEKPAVKQWRGKRLRHVYQLHKAESLFFTVCQAKIPEACAALKRIEAKQQAIAAKQQKR